MTEGDPVFVDTNVLVYASVAEAPLHELAVEKLRRLYEEGSELWVSNQVLREYLVTLSRPETFKNPPSLSVLIKTIRSFQRTFRMAVEVGTTDALLMVMGRVHVSGRQIHDANIVATMLTNNLKNLLTHNVEDFRRYVPLVTVIPLT